MSLNYLGIARFSPRRQFSSPKVTLPPEPSSNQNLMQDSKDVLLDRLNDLVARLSKPLTLEDGAVSTIHAEVDRIEQVVRSAEKQRGLKDVPMISEKPLLDEEDTFWRSPSPTLNLKMRFPSRFQKPQKTDQDVSILKASQLAKEAEDLSSKLSATVKEFQARREESDHIHDLLVTRVEKAAERILFLEYRVSEIEEDFENNQSELKFLRIQMQAIETQASQYIPQDQDPELTESILKWKVDWEDIEKKAKTRRKRQRLSLTPTVISGGELRSKKTAL